MILEDLRKLAVPVAQLAPLPRNPRKGDVAAIARSLEAFGQRKPIVVRRSDKTVLAGNHTLAAALSLGWAEIAVVWADDDDVMASAYALADNRTAELGSYDDQALAELIAEVQEADEALLAATGWTGDDLAELLENLEKGNLGQELTDPDSVPAIAPATSVPGDVWILGAHRVVCGDATTAEPYASLLNGDLAQLVVTDPPYNVAYEGKTAKALTIQNDDMDDVAFATFLLNAFAGVFDAVRPGAPMYVFHAESYGSAFRRAYVQSGFLLKQHLVWVKDRFVLGRQDYQWQHEAILYGWKPGKAHTWYGGRKLTTTILDDPNANIDFASMSHGQLVAMLEEVRRTSSVIVEARPARNDQHPTMKPVALIERLIENSSRPGAIVLDPFGGSGSTLIAAHRLGRKARLLELDPSYVDVICRRFQEFTGIKPVHAVTGVEHDFTV